MEHHTLMQKMYELEFGIFNYTDREAVAKDPLAVIRAKPQESILASSHLWDLAKRYCEAKIGERYEVSFIQYINLPMPEARLYDRMSFEVFGQYELDQLKKKNQAAEEIENIANSGKKNTP